MDYYLSGAGITAEHLLDKDVQAPAPVSWLRRRILRTLIYTAWERHGSVTAKTKLGRRRATRLRLEIWLCSLVDRYVRDGERLARSIEKLIPVRRLTVQALKVLQPDVIVAVTDIYRGQEADLFKSARRLGIPTLGIVASWDTLTSKGSYLVKPDHVAVWGKASLAHALCHGFDSDKVHIIGSLRLDAPASEAINKRLLPGKPPIVLVAGTSIAYMRDEEGLVRDLANLARKRRFRVWYRLHPRRLQGRSKADLVEQSRAWRDLGVYLDTGASAPGPLRGMLGKVKVVVTAFSTLVIEAALQGTPSILVSYGPSTGGSEGGDRETGDLLDHAGFEHMKAVTDWPGVVVAKTQEQLEQAVLARVHRTMPKWLASGLIHNAQSVVQTDGHTARRLATLIAGLVR
jgi:hypothetical protein